MYKVDSRCDTWHDVLIKRGFDPSTVKSLIGFVSWNKGDEFKKLGREITEILSGYEGKVFAKDAFSKNYGDKALLFFSCNIPESIGCEIFDAIMDFEQKEIYNSREMVRTFDGE